MARFKIGPRWIGSSEPLYVVAEAGVNHENSLATAKRMIQKAAEAKADAVKFQSYKARSLASRYSPAYWDRNKEPADSQYELFSRYDHFDPDDYRELAKCAAENNITFLTTAFDEEFVDELEDILPAFKVASADITYHPLLKKIASKQKPGHSVRGSCDSGRDPGGHHFVEDPWMSSYRLVTLCPELPLPARICQPSRDHCTPEDLSGSRGGIFRSCAVKVQSSAIKHCMDAGCSNR